MTKTKGFLLTAGIVLAMVFTLSCSDDKSDPPGPNGGTDGSLDGTWQKSSNTLEIEKGRAIITYSEVVEGAIDYGASNGSFRMEKMNSSGIPKDLQPIATFNYELSDDKGTLTISNATATGDDELPGVLNGTWTKSSQ